MPEQEEVMGVRLKLPLFYVNNATFWFNVAEQQFTIYNITKDNTKFSHLVTSLQEDVAHRVMAEIESPPATGKYDNLKEALMRHFTLTSAEMAATLLDLPGLGDQKPSQLLQKILSLHPKNEKPNFVTREIFLRQLPDDVRGHLTDKSEMELSALAQEADKFYSSIHSRRIQAVNNRPPPNRASATPVDVTCYYHARFGAKAKNCRPPCKFAQGN